MHPNVIFQCHVEQRENADLAIDSDATLASLCVKFLLEKKKKKKLLNRTSPYPSRATKKATFTAPATMWLAPSKRDICAIIRVAAATASKPRARRSCSSPTRPLRYCELMLTNDVVVEARTEAELNPGVFTRRLPTSVSNYLTISLPFTYSRT